MRSSFSDKYALVGRSSLYTLDVLERLNVKGLKHLGSVYAIGNYSIASFSYPYNGSNLALLVKASGKNPEIMDFTPVVFHSVDGRRIALTLFTATSTNTVWATN